MRFDPSLAVWQTPDGTVHRFAASAETGPLDVVVRTVRGITTASLAEGNQGEYRLDETTWVLDPTPAGYAKQVMLGAECVVVPKGKTATLTATARTQNGTPRVVTVPVFTGEGYYLAGVQDNNVIRGPATVPVEAAFGFPVDVTAPVALVRTASPGVPEEATVITEREVTFTPGEPVKISENISFEEAPGLGHGCEYRWVLRYGAGHDIVSDVIPIWVLGTDPACGDVDLATVPPARRPFPFTQEFSSLGVMEPSPGRTMQDHVDAFLRQWKGTQFGANLPGAWINFDAYNSPFFFVDATDSETPRHTVRHFDFHKAGWTGRGWYGFDGNARPWPQDHVAVDVPIPHNGRPAFGTDRAMGIVQVRDGQVESIREMWLARRRASGEWEAASIGETNATQHWAYPQGHTVQACGLSHLAGGLLVSEVARAIDYTAPVLDAGSVPDHDVIIGHINHPLSVAMPAPRAGQFSYPATYTDGLNHDDVSPAEGQFFGLRADLTHDDFVDRAPDAWHYILMVVLQRRGAFVSDTTRWSAAIITEADEPYGRGTWHRILPPDSPRTVSVPDDWWVLAPIFPDEAAFMAQVGG